MTKNSTAIDDKKKPAFTDKTVFDAKPKDKSYKLSDKGGLFVLIHANGSKYWRFKYRYGGKEKLLALGVYPDVPLADAREARNNARKLLAKDIDPAAMKKQLKHSKLEVAENSFESIAQEWFVKYSKNWASIYSVKVIRRLERDIFLWIGSRPISEITAPELLRVLQRIEKRGAFETAYRALQNCGQVFRYAIANIKAERDPSADLRGALPSPQKSHHASIADPNAIGELLRAIQSYKGSIYYQVCIAVIPFIFRPSWRLALS